MSANVAIINAGVEILAERGIEAVTVSEVSRRSGYSRQTINVSVGRVDVLRAAVAAQARTDGNERAIKWLDLAGM